MVGRVARQINRLALIGDNIAVNCDFLGWAWVSLKGSTLFYIHIAGHRHIQKRASGVGRDNEVGVDRAVRNRRVALKWWWTYHHPGIGDRCGEKESPSTVMIAVFMRISSTKVDITSLNQNSDMFLN